mmetsp:Transcript_5677/g.10273  ORF Transcript_5677/g.10273 Transcript_5677/m.10273 type:complete len:209 (-) Transcript_5677:1898-2524(-)
MSWVFLSSGDEFALSLAFFSASSRASLLSFLSFQAPYMQQRADNVKAPPMTKKTNRFFRTSSKESVARSAKVAAYVANAPDTKPPISILPASPASSEPGTERRRSSEIKCLLRCCCPFSISSLILLADSVSSPTMSFKTSHSQVVEVAVVFITTQESSFQGPNPPDTAHPFFSTTSPCTHGILYSLFTPVHFLVILRSAEQYPVTLPV